MRLLIVGATGMLGSSLCRVASKKGYSVLGVSRGRKPRVLFPGERHFVADISKKEEIFRIVQEERPEAIVHTAAVADVDLCERQPALAEAVNTTSSAWIAEVACQVGALLCYVSTDYVFDGKSPTPYREEDPTAPVNVYGRTKLEGEKAVQERHSSFYIVRTSWLFGEGHDSFVHHVLKWAEEKPQLRLVDDKWCTPTYTLDLASGILTLLEKKAPFGVYHVTNGGKGCSWRFYGQEVLARSGFNHVKVSPMTLQELHLAAARPAMTILDTEKCQRQGVVLRDWREALKEYLAIVSSLPRRDS